MMTPYEHLRVVQVAYNKATETVCKKYKLKHTEFDILIYLSQFPDKATATDIVKKMDLSKSLVSISLRRLEELGYVEGEFLGTNHRTIYLHLTDRASEVIDDGNSARAKFITSMLDGLDEDEVKILVELLTKIKKNMMSYIKTI